MIAVDSRSAAPAPLKKTTRFRRLLESNRLEFLIEAHNGLSARIGEEAGFAGIWASGLCLAAQFGVRDSNEASWTQILDMLEFMADAASVPILLDGDTGYGNFNNVRRLVRKLEQRGVAAVCIEDKLFPKKNSFLAGDTQPLADIDEFCGRISAGKDAQSDDDFCIVARTEALIAGWGMPEALRRAEAYVEAGADAILAHSARTTAEEVLAFQRKWGDRSPVVIVPTKYYATPTEVFEQAGFSVAIWANHMLRASIAAMKETAHALAEDRNLMSVEDQVAPLAEVFRLQRTEELARAEDRFLPRPCPPPIGVILAASRGGALGSLTAQRPKTMLRIDGKPLLEHIVDGFRAAGVRNVTVVRGYRKEAVDLPGVRYVDNDDYEENGELHSLALALRQIQESASDILIGYGDVLFHRFVLQGLRDAGGDLAIPVDTHWEGTVNRGRHADYAECSAPYSRKDGLREIHLERIGLKIPPDARHGEWMGFLKVAAPARTRLQETLERLLADPAHRRAGMATLLNGLVEAGHAVRVLYTTGHWLDVDSVADAVRAGSF